MKNTEDRIDQLFEELVPLKGKADTVAGEIIRAITRLKYQQWNDGRHIGVGYGNTTCNHVARYLMATCSREIEYQIKRLWGCKSDEKYDKGMKKLDKLIVDYLDTHAELLTTKNYDDITNYIYQEDLGQ